MKGDEYQVATGDTPLVHRVTIEEAETSTRTISLTAPNQVLEGDDIAITLTNNEPLGAGESIAVAFNVVVDPIGYFDADNSGTSPVTFTDTTANNRQTIILSTIDSDAIATNGTIAIGVVRGNNYEPATTVAHQVTIVAKETLPQVSISRSSTESIYEGDVAEFTLFAPNVTLTEPLSVGLTVSQGATDNFIDATSVSTSANIATTGTGVLRVNTIADGTQEDDGTITVALETSTDQTYLLGSPATASVTVQDNDDPALHSINIVASTSQVTEGVDAMAIFNITATGGTSGTTDPIDVVINISQEGNFLANAGGDRAPIAVTPGNAQGVEGNTVPLAEAIENDTDFEADGKIIAKIVSSATYSVGENAMAEIDIINDDTLPVVSIATPTITAEGDTGITDLDFEVSLSKAPLVDVVVNFTVGKDESRDVDGNLIEAGDTATLNDDYTVANATNTLTFPANSIDAQTISIDVVGDVLNETDESFTITLSLPAGNPFATLPQDPTATGTIPNDDTAPVVSIANAAGVEGSGTSNGTVEFEVTLSEPSGLPVKVTYSTTDGTATTPGTDDDFISVTDQVLIIPASSNSNHIVARTIAVTTNADDDTEDNETFTVALTLPSDANAVFPVDPDNAPVRLTTITATGTILDDDTIAALTIADATTATIENAGAVDFVVTSSVPRTITVNYQAAEVSGRNFLHDSNGQEDAQTAELTFRPAAGSSSYVDTLRVAIDDDGTGEVTGQIMVTLLAETGGPTTYSVPTNGDESAMATIWDDDAPELAIGSPTTVAEDIAGGNVTFTVLARVSPNRMVPVNYEVVESTNPGDGDFIDAGNEGTIAAGVGSPLDFTEGKVTAPITVALDNDGNPEGNSTVTVTLRDETGGITNYTVAASPDNSSTTTITDDDILRLPILSFTTTMFNADEKVAILMLSSD